MKQNLSSTSEVLISFSQTVLNYIVKQLCSTADIPNLNSTADKIRFQY